MGNLRVPRKIDVDDSALFTVTELRSRSGIRIKNAGPDAVGLTTNAAETDFANCYPLAANAEIPNLPGANIVYAICAAGDVAAVWVWEIE